MLPAPRGKLPNRLKTVMTDIDVLIRLIPSELEIRKKRHLVSIHLVLHASAVFADLRFSIRVLQCDGQGIQEGDDLPNSAIVCHGRFRVLRMANYPAVLVDADS